MVLLLFCDITLFFVLLNNIIMVMLLGNELFIPTYAAGNFYGFYGSRTSQFPPDENGVWIGFLQAYFPIISQM